MTRQSARLSKALLGIRIDQNIFISFKMRRSSLNRWLENRGEEGSCGSELMDGLNTPYNETSLSLGNPSCHNDSVPAIQTALKALHEPIVQTVAKFCPWTHTSDMQVSEDGTRSKDSLPLHPQKCSLLWGETHQLFSNTTDRKWLQLLS
ncbi:protein diaphanous-like protein 1 [Platysternon megacephalum]|uniref:Protein diaphanous-like protein 1 n=1 Tax=Platysternon megacephalum TaxID=55544 RepID=A0A4D9DVN2_9SAUR|nr:protein diaphanous-like protein 1 [Platysternon megacephalum]